MFNEFKQILVLIFPYWKKYWKNEIIIVIMLILSFLVSIYTPLKFQEVIDSLINYDTDSSFIMALSMIGFLMFLRILISWFYAVYITRVGESFIIDITSAVYLSVLKKRRTFWMKFSPNDVLTRLTQDIVSVKSFLFDFLHNSFFQGMIILGIVSVLFFLNFKAGIIILILTAAVFISSYFGSGFLNKKSFMIRQIASRFTHLFQIGISYPPLNFSWNLFSYHIEKYKINAKEMRKEQVTFVNQMQLINQGIALVNLIIGTVILFIVLRSDLYSGLITIGGMFSIIMYSNSVIQATAGLAANIVSTKLNRVSVLRIYELQDSIYEKAKTYYKPEEKIIHPFFRNEFQNGFLLPNTDKHFIILNSSNGSGKSTLAQTLTGFDDLAEKICGEQWFLLPSEPIVIEGTLLDNINLISGKLITTVEINDILKANCLEELMSIFPEGFSTEVSTTSEKVSRGQKQAVGLLAAVIKDPTAIIIDEGLNSLDQAVKAQIKVPLLRWLKKRKSILIDHKKFYDEELSKTKLYKVAAE